MHCPAIGATGAPIDFNNYNNLKTDLRHGVQVVGGSNPLAPTIFSMSYRVDKNNSCLILSVCLIKWLNYVHFMGLDVVFRRLY